jgi:hypothetical protein
MADVSLLEQTLLEMPGKFPREHGIDWFRKFDIPEEYPGIVARIDRALAACQSPIERALAVAIEIASNGDHSIGGTFWTLQNDKETDNTPCSTIVGTPQFHLQGFKLDFRLKWFNVVPDPRNPTIRDGGWEVPGFYEAEKTLFIECDGHDHHERNKEQAQRDRKKDRYFQKHGMTLLRFTGSEIWADPMACANEIIGYFLDADSAAWETCHPTKAAANG